ncbi:MAG: hypothetical protein H0W72_04355 [Planctomycetes bacterium]|nr:hypothetical protein [Planctomycetota bacterium]
MKPIARVAIGIGLIGMSVFAFKSCRSWMLEGVPNGHLPGDFPHAVIAPEDNGHPEKVQVVRSRLPPVPPVIIDAKDMWPAFACDNSDCPGRVGEVRFVFAKGAGTGTGAPQPSGVCPKCSPLHHAGTTMEEKLKYDPTKLVQYYTPEAEKILEEVRAALR